MIVALHKLNKDGIKAKLYIEVCSIMYIDIDLHFCENSAPIQRHIPLGTHTMEMAQNPDLTIPRAYN